MDQTWGKSQKDTKEGTEGRFGCAVLKGNWVGHGRFGGEIVGPSGIPYTDFTRGGGGGGFSGYLEGFESLAPKRTLCRGGNMKGGKLEPAETNVDRC